MMGYGGFGGYAGLGWIGMIIGLIITVVVIIGLVILAIWVVRRLSHSGGSTTYIQPSGSQPAKEIAQARYARGEISREEYQQILADLQK